MFQSSNEFCLYLERVKREQELDSYTETLTWFYENETDLEFESIVRLLNRKIIGHIENEARHNNMLKNNESLNVLF